MLFTLSMFSVNTTWDGTTWSNGVPSTNDNAIIAGNYTVGVSGGATN